MIKKVVQGICLVLVIVLGFSFTVHAIGLEVALGGWNQKPQGDIGYKPISANDSLDLERDLKYDTEFSPIGRVKIDMPLFLPNIYLMGTRCEFDGRGRRDVNFKFGDRIFTANVDFYSKIKLNHYDIALYYGLPFLKKATADMLNMEVGVNARIVDFKAEVRQESMGIEESKSLTVPIPMVYIGAQFTPIERLAIEAEGRGISYSGNSLISLIGRIKFKLMDPFFIAGGYRYDEIKIDEEDIDAKVKFHGPFAEVGIQF